MVKLRHLLKNEHRQVAVIAALAFATAVCVIMLAVRVLYANSTAYIRMLWNLFLAWLPMLAALAAYNLRKRDARRGWAMIVPCAFVWLLFFPNAPYMVTDMLHLQPRYGVPLWYDLLLLVSFAWTGTFLGLVSLYLMHTLVRRSAGVPAGWLFTFTVLAITGFGVYLGLFPRWNSWDLFLNPMSLLSDVWQRVRHPFADSRTIVFSMLFSLCITAMYFVLSAVMGFRSDGHDRS